ncbi:hypothetical protein B0H19DRAFT_1163134 [Mycena capillaripes]|nr:hypothetical protein B0H19DRAFT_1163134 [Mycena capillaripes]
MPKRNMNEKRKAFHHQFFRGRDESSEILSDIVQDSDAEDSDSESSGVEDASSPSKGSNVVALSEDEDDLVVVRSPKRRKLSSVALEADSEEAGLPRKRVHRRTSNSTTAAGSADIPAPPALRCNPPRGPKQVKAPPSTRERETSPPTRVWSEDEVESAVRPWTPKRPRASKAAPSSDSEVGEVPRKRVCRHTSDFHVEGLSPLANAASTRPSSASTSPRRATKRVKAPTIARKWETLPVNVEEEADSESTIIEDPDQPEVGLSIPSIPTAHKRKDAIRSMANARARRPTPIETEVDDGDGLLNGEPSTPRRDPSRLAKAQTPTTRAREALPQNSISCKNEDDSEVGVGVPNLKRRKVVIVESDSDASETPRTLTRAHRRKSEAVHGAEAGSSPKESRQTPVCNQHEVVSLNADVEDSDDEPLSRLREVNPKIHTGSSTAKQAALLLTSGDESDVLRLFRRRKLSVIKQDSDAGDSADETSRKRSRVHRRISDNEDAKVTVGDDLPSNLDSEDVDDLELPTPPSPSKPTPKEKKRAALQEYGSRRKSKSSPTSVRKTKVEETDSENSESDEGTFAPQMFDSDASDSGSDTDHEVKSETSESFIDDTDQNADAQELEAGLGPEYYARRELKEQFASFVEYSMRLYFDPDFLSAGDVAEGDRYCYEAAFEAMERRTDAVADSMLLSTWSAPFKATLDSRPILLGPVPCEDSKCQACWTRGRFSCSANEGCGTLTTRKGLYNRETFKDEPEEKLEYCGGTQDDFENGAEAEELLYPPGFRLVIGARCARRAVAYHQARHYMYNVFIRVKDEIKRLEEHNEELLNHKGDLLDTLHDRFTEELWRNFCLDSTQWKNFIHRKD